MSKEKLTNQLKKAYKKLEEEFKNKGSPNTIKDNNVDYDNCNIYAMRQKIKDLEAKLAESEERLKEIDNWKENHGYTNYEDIYMLEDLQSRAFQSEDDTNVVNELLDCLNISDENEILPTIKHQLAEKEKEIEKYRETKLVLPNKIDIEKLKEKFNAEPCVVIGLDTNEPTIDQDKISFAIEQLEKVKGSVQAFDGIELIGFIDNQINVLRNNKDGIH